MNIDQYDIIHVGPYQYYNAYNARYSLTLILLRMFDVTVNHLLSTIVFFAACAFYSIFTTHNLE